MNYRPECKCVTPFIYFCFVLSNVILSYSINQSDKKTESLLVILETKNITKTYRA